jgi:hypothetical protein
MSEDNEYYEDEILEDSFICDGCGQEVCSIDVDGFETLEEFGLCYDCYCVMNETGGAITSSL